MSAEVERAVEIVVPMKKVDKMHPDPLPVAIVIGGDFVFEEEYYPAPCVLCGSPRIIVETDRTDRMYLHHQRRPEIVICSLCLAYMAALWELAGRPSDYMFWEGLEIRPEQIEVRWEQGLRQVRAEQMRAHQMRAQQMRAQQRKSNEVGE